MKTKVLISVFLTLVVLFLLYSVSIYVAPLRAAEENRSDRGGEGHLVWQKYNCQSCHQLYGLGGYLGPDLTNILSKPGKTEHYVRAMISSGTEQMPAFQLEEEELRELLVFLKTCDQSGNADPRSFKTHWSGMIQPHAEAN